MDHASSAIGFVLLLAAMLALLALGHRLGAKRIAETEQERVGLISIDTAIFGLLGLVLAFTYSGASQRFEQRRAITIQEANAVGTAWLRIDLVAPALQPPLREGLRGYGSTLLAAYDALPDETAFDTKLREAKAMQSAIWTHAIAAVHDAPPHVTQLLLPALNDMFDLTVNHEAMVRTHTPGAILAVLVGLALCCSVLAGYGLAGAKSASRYLHMLGFALVVSATIYIVLDYDYPRFGFIRLDFADDAMRATLAGMK